MTIIKVSGIFITLLFIINGCGSKKDDPAPADCSPSAIEVTIEDRQAASGCTSEDGSLTASAEGTNDNSVFMFSINGNDFQESGNFTGLAAGNYTVTARDENGCQAMSTAVVGVEGSDIAIATIAASDAGCETSNGEIIVDATGEQPLMYKLNDGTFQTDNVFAGLPSGTYQVAVKDASNCEVSAETKIFNGTSYEQQVKSILQTNCAVSGCHNGDNGANRNWTLLTNVQNNAGNIKALTQNGTMPPAGSGQSLTEEEKDLIACWVDDGARNN